jgi:hypothetical protein
MNKIDIMYCNTCNIHYPPQTAVPVKCDCGNGMRHVRMTEQEYDLFLQYVEVMSINDALNALK